MTNQDKVHFITPPYELVAKALECSPDTLNLNSALANHANWDSFGHLAIMLALEEEYNVVINDDTIRKYSSISAIIERYEELQK